MSPDDPIPTQASGRHRQVDVVTPGLKVVGIQPAELPTALLPDARRRQYFVSFTI